MSESPERVEEIGSQLRDKIRSKFQSSTFLAGFGFTILSIEISMLWTAKEVPNLLSLSIPLILSAICLFIAAALKLDALTMPKRFWKEAEKEPGVTDKDVSRLAYLKDDDLWQIQRRMIFYWTWMTVVATMGTAVSMVLVLLPMDSVQHSAVLVEETFQNSWMVLCLVFFYILLLRGLEKLFHTKSKFNPCSENPWKPLFRAHD